jgi:predicted dehydrogenase
MLEIGLGVIGVGTWGALHARVYATLPGARLAAVCDTNFARAQEIATLCGGATVYTDYRDLLADREVQAVSIVLPDFLHHDVAIAAARAGKHLLVEKPLATTEPEALEILQAARETGVTLFVDFHNRWSPLFASLKQSLDAGELGQPQFVSYRLNDTLFVPTKMLSWAGRSSVAWFLASHCLDTLLWLMGARAASEGGAGDRIERLYTVARSRLLATEYGVNTPDFYLTTLEWRSGLVTHLENAWILPGSGPSIFDLKCEFLGSRGAFFIDGSHHGAVQKQADRALYPDVLVAPIVQNYPVGFGAESIRHFARCVQTGQPPLVDGLDGLAVTRLILKMEESARLGQPVPVGDIYALPPPA